MFKNPLSIAAAVVLLCALGYAAAVPAAESGAFSSIGLSGTLRPLPDGSYLFAATFTDLRTGRKLSAPQLHFESGSTATTTIADVDSEGLSLTVSADKSKDAATVELSRRRNGRVSVLNRLDFRLQ